MDMVLVSGVAAFAAIVVTMSSLIQMELRERRRAAHRRGAGVSYAHSCAYPHGHIPHRRSSSSQPRRAALPPPCNPWAPFVVRSDTTPDDLKHQYRALACRYHPDRGGDPRVMAQINAVYRELLQRRS